jgi:multiple sugar transport system ATP-binding protein
VVLRAAGTELVAVFRERHALAPGQRLHVRPEAPRTHLFDADTGVRL